MLLVWDMKRAIRKAGRFEKNGFRETGVERETRQYAIVVLEKKI